MLNLPEIERDAIISVINNTIMPVGNSKGLMNICDYLKGMQSVPDIIPSISEPVVEPVVADEVPVDTAPAIDAAPSA